MELIFGNVRSKPKARKERWCLRPLYNFIVKHKTGFSNKADYMSRNATEPEDDKWEKFTESCINIVSSVALPRAISRSE